MSFDTVKKNRAFAEKFDFPFQLLCDTEKAMGLAYQACASATDASAKRLTYVIDADGIITSAIDTKEPAEQAAALLEN